MLVYVCIYICISIYMHVSIYMYVHTVCLLERKTFLNVKIVIRGKNCLGKLENTFIYITVLCNETYADST